LERIANDTDDLLLSQVTAKTDYSCPKQEKGAGFRRHWTGLGGQYEVMTATAVEVIVPTGPPPNGMELSWPGQASVPGQNVRFDLQKPWGILGGSLMFLFRPNFSVRPLPNADPEWIHLVVFANAPPK
jgi:hypothetical protein